ALTVTAHSEQTVEAIVAAFSMAISGAGTVGLSGSGSGVYAQNQIAAQVKAFVDGGTGITSTSLTLAADDASEISTVAGSASVAAAFAGTVSVALAIGVALAQNEIDNEVEAYARNANVRTTAGGIAITSDESATIEATSAAASLSAAIAGTAGVAVSGAGA